jgi:sugar O-acyltransferase (sialic acid O-acetyltransferase NeuD family)
MKTLAIIGSGDLGQQLAHYALTDGHYAKVCFFDDFSLEKEKFGIPIIGKTADISRLFSENRFDELLIGIGYNHIEKRKEFFERYYNKIPFGKIVHSTSWSDPSSKIESGAVIYPNCSIDIRAVIGANTILNNGCTIAHDTIVGAHSFLSPRVALAGFINIGESCIIGINATIIDNITIVAKTQVGGGTVVVKNIEKSGLYVGNPQRFIR